MSEIAVNALRAKRAELAGEIIHHQHEIDRIRQDLVHVDAVLRLFSPDSSPEHIIPKYPQPPRLEFLERNEIRRRCYEAMREHGVITADSVVTQLMRDKELHEGDRRLRSDLIARTLISLDGLLRVGRVVKIGIGRDAQWRAKS